MTEVFVDVNLDEIEPDTHVISSCRFRSGIDNLFIHGRLGVGFKPEKLFDWRFLEQRSHELKNRWLAISNEFWNTLRTMLDNGRKTRGCDAVWVVDVNDSSDRNVMVYRDGGLSRYTASELIDNGIKDAKKTAIIADEQTSLYLCRLYDRDRRYMTRYNAYRRAFTLGVEARLHTFIDKNLCIVEGRYSHRLFNEGVFVISNCDRRYVVFSTECGTFVWKSTATAYSCK